MLEWKEITICFHGQTYLAKGELKGDAGEIVGILGESGCGWRWRSGVVRWRRRWRCFSGGSGGYRWPGG